jgi:hypothetical protein
LLHFSNAYTLIDWSNLENISNHVVAPHFWNTPSKLKYPT